MRGRLPSNRAYQGPTAPDWSNPKLAWYVYCDTVKFAAGEEIHCYRISPRYLSQQECRRFEQFVTAVRRCSLRTVRDLLKRGVPAAGLQAAVDGLADAQAARRPTRPNVYVELLAKRLRDAREYKESQAREAA